ncbi:hypothetical protein B296_00007171 [Ensete ventricosum]|uniref:Uncharacterized protein n=1 Tax=Ensete ventricosum TaxID=4639 RepID=A0A426YLF9_ENSVE|nr:hypothetical protein B296_00007171 [Ensete ventricosum]
MSEAMTREATTQKVGESSKTTWGASRREGFVAGSARANGCASSSKVDSSTKATRLLGAPLEPHPPLAMGALGKAGGEKTMPCRVLVLAERVVREVLNAGGSAASIYPDLKIEEDPFASLPEDDNMEMPNEVPFYGSPDPPSI